MDNNEIQPIIQDPLFPKKDNVHPPIPASGDLLRQVVTDPAVTDNFLYGGYMVAEGLRKTLDLVGRPFSTIGQVLDYGCGSARVLRWFREESRTCNFFGSDINPEAIEWCRRYISFAEFSVNNPAPPLDFPDASFDLIYGISVMTHLDEELQLAWLEELNRLIRPGGLVILTVHGEDLPPLYMSAQETFQYYSQGQFYKRVVEKGGVDGLPDFYQVAYHTRAYIEDKWSKYFQLAAYIKHGMLYMQDTVVMKKPVDASADLSSTGKPGYIYLDLPMGCFDTPRIADTLTDDKLTVTGWCFHTDGGAVEVDLWIDGRRVETSVAKQLSPSVGKVFHAYPSAKRCGFSAIIPIGHLAKGPHRLYGAPRTSLVPSFATYFFKA